MGYELASGVHACLADRSVFFLDIHRDRYCRADGHTAEILADRARESSTGASSELDRLVEAGLLAQRPGPDTLSLCRKSAPASDLHGDWPARPAPRAGEVMRLAILTGAVQALLRLRSFRTALLWTSQTPVSEAESRPSRALVAEQVARFQVARAVLPLTPRCLLDSLVLLRATRQQGLATELVIGVRPLPFAAHCWVEVHGIVLNGSREGVSCFQPILNL
jgi:hypothetical protein